MNELLNEQKYYASPGPMTDPGIFSRCLDGLPEDITALCEIIQRNLIHIFWAERYGVSLTDSQNQAVSLRSLAEKLSQMNLDHNQSLSLGRNLHSRQVGNCRDFSLFLTAILRHQGRPARARCGFGRYFLPGHYEDHWVCEVWQPGQSRWVLVDAQLDAFQRKTLEINFDPLDVPRDQFITAGVAWQLCRSGEAHPDQFGIFDMHGWWFIWGNVIRDFYALNKVEILPWDGGWGYLTHALDEPLVAEAELQEYDQIAALCASADISFDQFRAMFSNDPKFLLPGTFSMPGG